MTQQFLRAASLVLGNSQGQGLDLSTLRLDFTISHSTVQTPRTAMIRVTNVSKNTAAKVQKEFTQVSLSAGYKGAIGLLFQGEIRQFRYGRENPTDTYLDIIAADGDQVYSQGFISQVIDTGYTSTDVFREIVAAGATQGLTMGDAPPSNGQAGIRPKVIWGPIRDHCRVLGTSTGSSWSITDGRLNYATLQVALAPTQQAIVLTPSTGLIGIPKQTIDGIEATCLLNPKIKAGSYVLIDRQYITAAPVSTDAKANLANPNQTERGSNSYIAGLSPTGTYRVVYVDHYGDTRGDPWYSVMSCFADDGGAKQLGAGLVAVP